jgi:hypothetical protein
MVGTEPRFAELDAQVEARKAERNHVAAVPRENKPPRPPSPLLPKEVRKELATFARKLKRGYRQLFASNPVYRKRAGQFLTALLPPKPRRGRPGRVDVTEAIRLLELFSRQYPNELPAEHWARVYPLVIPGYDEMNAVQQRDARERLRERVRWRRSAGSVNGVAKKAGAKKSDETTPWETAGLFKPAQQSRRELCVQPRELAYEVLSKGRSPQ